MQLPETQQMQVLNYLFMLKYKTKKSTLQFLIAYTLFIDKQFKFIFHNMIIVFEFRCFTYVSMKINSVARKPVILPFRHYTNCMFKTGIASKL